MGNLEGYSDQELDRLIAGQAPAGGGESDPMLAQFIRDVGTAFGAASLPPAAEQRFRDAAVKASRLAIDKGDPAARPASKAHGPGRQASGLPKWRRRTVFSTLFASLTAKVAGVAIAAAAATGGLAAAGALPGPAQQAVSDAAATIGIHIPSPHGSTSTQVTTTASSAANDHASVTGTAHGGVTATAAAGINHGNCVSYASSVAGTLGLTGSAKGQFVADVVKDSSAVSAQVTGTTTPDPACQNAITAAAAAAQAAAPGKSGQTHGPSVTATASASTGNAHNPTGFGPTSHPSATDHPGSGSSGVTGTANNPTGFGPTNHPGKP